MVQPRLHTYPRTAEATRAGSRPAGAPAVGHLAVDGRNGTVILVVCATNPHGHPVQQPRLNQVLDFVIKEHDLQWLVGHRLHDVVLHYLVHLAVWFEWHLAIGVQLALKILCDTQRINRGDCVVTRGVRNQVLGSAQLVQALNQVHVGVDERLVRLHHRLKRVVRHLLERAIHTGTLKES